MRNKVLVIMLAALLPLAACGNKDSVDNEATNGEVAKSAEGTTEEKKSTNEEQIITYLNEEYTIPANATKIVTASQEAMEDAAILDVKPIGAIATGGKFPEYLGDSMSEAVEIGDKQQPSIETLLQLDPDVILGTSKFQPEVVENLNSVATMVPISHISMNWKENLLTMGEITRKTAEAEKIIAEYEANVAEVREQLKGSVADKKVLMIRIRGGNIYIYSPDFYFNPVLYADLGISIPKEVASSKSQEMISLEKLAEINPDYLFVQFEENENADAPQVLNELQNNAIWTSMNAVKNNKLFINAVPPLAAGGTAWSKTEFIKVVKDNLVK